MGEVLPLPSRPESRRGSRPESRRRPPDEPQTRPEPLWREVLGHQLRVERTSRGERIADVAQRAGLSPQYLSEVERGRKDPSSEMLSALAGALDLTVRELTRRAGADLRIDVRLAA